MGKSTNKDRTNIIRTYDKNGYRQRADAIIFKDKSFSEVLMVSSRSDPNCWTVPGGGREPNEDGRCTSIREAKEEAGVVGTIQCFVGTFKDDGRKTNTEVYILVVDELIDTYEDKEESE